MRPARQVRLEKIRQARKEKAEVAAAKADAAREKAIEAAENAGVEPPDVEPFAADAMPRRGLARKADGTPTAKTQRNHRCAEACGDTDPDSHLMHSGGAYLQSYNCQLAVDSSHQVIVAIGVSNQPPDTEHLEPMLQRIAANTGAIPEVMTLDAGYWSEDNAGHSEDLGIDAQGRRHQRPHGPQTQKQEGHPHRRPALTTGFSEGVGDRGAGERRVGPGRCGEGQVRPAKAGGHATTVIPM